MQSANRRGSVLAIVVLLVVIIGLLGMALMDRSMNSSARAAWGRDHLMLRLLAESAAEELFVALAKASNDPASPLFTRLRTLIPDEGEPALPIAIPGLEVTQLRTELPVHEATMGATIQLSHEISIQKAEEVSDDGIENRGMVRITVAATAGRRLFRMTERATFDRAFRVARTTIHHPLQLDALIVKKLPKQEEADPDAATPEDGQDGPGSAGQADPSGGAGADPGANAGNDQQGQAPDDEEAQGAAQEPHSFFTPHIQGVRAMPEILGGDAGEGMRPSPDKWVEEVADAIAMLHPKAARRRAHFVTRKPRQLRWFVQGRLARGLPVNGLLFSSSKRKLMLNFEKFTGRAVIVARGPVILGDISVADPRRDSLTIASGRKIRVVGARVDASLVSFGGKRKGVTFMVKTRVNGTVISQRIPKGRNTSKEDFDASQIGGVEGVDYEGNEDAAPPDGQVDMEELKMYATAFSPNPIRVEHALE